MKKITTILHSTRAAIDLASIMVGIIVIGIIGGVIAATVFAVIPWTQDNAAKNKLDSVATAQSAYKGFSSEDGTPRFGTSAQLADENSKGKTLLKEGDEYAVETFDNGNCYLAVVRSDNANKFYYSTDTTQPKLYNTALSADDVACGTPADLDDLINGINPGDAIQATDFSEQCGPTDAATPGSILFQNGQEYLTWNQDTAGSNRFTSNTLTFEGSTATVTLSGQGQAFCDMNNTQDLPIGDFDGDLAFQLGQTATPTNFDTGSWEFTEIGTSIADDFTLTLKFEADSTQAAAFQAVVDGVSGSSVNPYFLFDTVSDDEARAYSIAYLVF